MIKAQDLRPGNIIESNHFTSEEWRPIHITGTQVSPFGTGQISWKAQGCCDLGLTPIDDGYRTIPLTPEILEKCGFRAADGYDFPTYEDDLGNRISFDAGIYKYWLGGIYQDYAEIRSLHRLQNFHFEYTNQELEVSL